MASHSPPSRCGLSTSAYAARAERRPTLTASACAANGLPSPRKAHRCRGILTKDEQATAWPLWLFTAREQIQMRQYEFSLCLSAPTRSTRCVQMLVHANVTRVNIGPLV